MFEVVSQMFFENVKNFFANTGSIGFVAVGSAIIAPILVLSYFDIFIFSRIRGILRRDVIRILLRGRSVNLNQSKNFPQFSSDDFKNLKTNNTNFIFLSYELEKRLRVVLSVVSGKDVASEYDCDLVFKELLEKKVITKNGAKRVKYIRWLREIIIQGKGSVITPKCIELMVELAWTSLQELNFWLKDYQENRGEKVAQMTISGTPQSVS